MNLLKILSLLVIATSVMPLWQFNIGITLQAHDIFGLIFIFFYIPSIVKTKNIIPSKPLKIFFLFFLIFIFIKIFSFLGLFIFFVNNSIDFNQMADQYLKSIVTYLINFILFICLAHFIFRYSISSRKIFVHSFIGIIIIGCFYQMIKLYFVIYHQIFLDDIIWPAISNYNSFEGFNSELLAFGYDPSSRVNVGGNTFALTFFRLGGFDNNPNGHASLLLCILPFLFFNVIDKKNKWNFYFVIVIVSLVLTMSRSGLFGFAVSSIVILFIERNYFLRKINYSIVILFILTILIINNYWDHLYWFYRGNDMFNLSSRGLLYTFALDTISNYPFGIGDNNSNLLVGMHPKILAITGADLHSFWLMIFVELGIIGGLFYLVYSFFIINNYRYYKNIYSKSLTCSFIGIIMASLFNNTLLSFPVQLFIFLFYCLSTSSGNDLKNKSINRYSIAL